MKKQLNISASARKLSLGKKTISNLNSFGPNGLMGGKTGGCHPHGSKNCTQNGGNSCPGHTNCAI